MKITAISSQIRDKNRVNISIDGKYRFSLDAYQLIDLGIKVGQEFEEADLIKLEQESQFGKVYGRALEYCLMRPHSVKEVRDYLYRKSRPSRTKMGELKSGISEDITARVLNRLIEKGYVDDNKFAKYWVDNRSLSKGISSRKLINELRLKGINLTIIEQTIDESDRDDNLEIQKIISKKRLSYPDDQKLAAYLVRLGFSYDDIKQALSNLQD